MSDAFAFRIGTAAILCALNANSSAAAASDSGSDPEVLQKVATAVDHYVTALGCEHGRVRKGDIAALELATPQEAGTGRGSLGRYAVIWSADIGCAGGSHTITDNIAVVRMGSDGNFYVQPSESSPAIRFDATLTNLHIVSHTSTSINFTGVYPRFSDRDGQAARITMAMDVNGNWDVAPVRPRKSIAHQPSEMASGASRK
jgi:hypothetical protein